MIERTLVAISLLGVGVPVVAFAYQIFRALFIRGLIFRDNEGHLLRTVTHEDIYKSDPEEIRRLHREIKQRMKSAREIPDNPSIPAL